MADLQPSTLYFAYGSNMSRARLEARIAIASVLGRAELCGHRLAFDKPGRDGTGKANVVESAADIVHGVVYALRDREWDRLDACEPGYERVERTVVLVSGRTLFANLYVHHGSAVELTPSDEYLHHLLVGAREHSLPKTFIDGLRARISG